MNWQQIADRLPGGNRRTSRRAVAYLADLEAHQRLQERARVIDLTVLEQEREPVG
jgi:hypothetical protein